MRNHYCKHCKKQVTYTQSTEYCCGDVIYTAACECTSYTAGSFMAIKTRLHEDWTMSIWETFKFATKQYVNRVIMINEQT